ncbi:MAG: D-alanine--D-alanine ligase [Bdellovibrionales bacterium]|nr:D-alanine--D-alanine ligase [Bdellovibrionales bacterium]
MKKKRVIVLYGGKSGEHEVPLQSAASVIRNLDRGKFEVVPVGIDKDGRWRYHDLSLIENTKGKELPVFRNQPEVTLVNRNEAALVPVGSGSPALDPQVDVVFPVMHGPLCEDGTIQGMMEIADVAYVGSGVLGSALGMDKDMAKRLVQLAGCPIAPYVALKKADWEAGRDAVIARGRGAFQLPVFVKPSNMGSSVGVHKVKDWKDLPNALHDAFQYDEKILVEKGIDAREIEVAVLEADHPGERPLTGVPGEVKPSGSHDFYSYESKYLDENGAELILPAKLTEEQALECRALAVKIFDALELSGMARVDFLMDKRTGTFYFNEVNTIPGFTSISMYPKMMEAAGIPYGELLTRLIDIALRRHERRKMLRRDFTK